MLELLNRYDARFERQFRAALTAFLNLRTKRRAEARENARADADSVTKHIRHYWVDEEGDKTFLTDPDPEPEAVPGSFGSPAPTADEPAFPKPFASLQALYRRLSAFIQAAPNCTASGHISGILEL